MIFQNTLRANLAIIIVLMGVAGLLLALVTGDIYKKLVLDSQRTNMYSLLEYKTIEEIEELSEVVNDLGLSLQTHSGFRAAFKAHDVAALTNRLNNQFRQYFVTAGILDLENLFVFDREFNFITGSHNGLAYQRKGELPCLQVLQYAKQRKGTNRLRVLNDICMHEKTPLHISVIPVGGLAPQGFLVVLSRLIHTFSNIENDINMPLRIFMSGGEVLYESRQWSEQYSHEDNLEADYSLKAKNGKEIVTLRILDDMKLLKQKLATAQTRLILIASSITVIAMLIAFLILNRSVLLPMKTLLTQLKLIQSDRKQLGKQIEVRGNNDIRQLAKGFNDVSQELGELYQSLAKMAFTDPLTRLYNRAWFHEQLNKCINMGFRHNNPFTVLVMDLNKFKPINDNYGHHVGDQILEEVSRRMQNVLRGEDILARLYDEQDDNLNDEVIARMGGDEFAVLLPMIGSVADVEVVVKKLIHAIEQSIEIDENCFNIGMSIGIAMYPQQGDDGDLLLRLADEAMYQAKKKGGGYAFSQVKATDIHILEH